MADFQSALQAIGLPHAPRVEIRSFHKSTLALTEIQGPANFGMTAAAPRDSAYLVQLRLRDCLRSDYFINDTYLAPSDRGAGAIQFHDLRNDTRVNAIDPFHLLDFYLPHRLIACACDEASLPTVQELHIAPGSCHRDPVISHLMITMAGMLGRSDEASSLFCDHIAHALTLHLAVKYGGVQDHVVRLRGGLAPWQANRVKEMLATELSDDLSLAQLAKECRLSVRQLSRAFLHTFGMPPHTYRLRHRLLKARQYLMGHEYSLAEIAILCGFANQSHLTRIFQRVIGMSPGHWRRSHRPPFSCATSSRSMNIAGTA